MQDAMANLVVRVLLGLHLALIPSLIALYSRKIWWRNCVRSLLYRARAEVRADRLADGTRVFAIRPARASRVGALLFLAGLSLMVWSFVTGVAGLFFVALVPAVIGGVIFTLGGRYRRASSFEIGAEGLRIGELGLPLEQILSFRTERSDGIFLTLPGRPLSLRQMGLGGVLTHPLTLTLRAETALLDQAHLVTVLSVGGGRSVLAGGLDRTTAARLVQALELSLSALRR